MKFRGVVSMRCPNLFWPCLWKRPVVVIFQKKARLFFRIAKSESGKKVGKLRER